MVRGRFGASRCCCAGEDPVGEAGCTITTNFCGENYTYANVWKYEGVDSDGVKQKHWGFWQDGFRATTANGGRWSMATSVAVNPLDEVVYHTGGFGNSVTVSIPSSMWGASPQGLDIWLDTAKPYPSSPNFVGPGFNRATIADPNGMNSFHGEDDGGTIFKVDSEANVLQTYNTGATQIRALAPLGDKVIFCGRKINPITSATIPVAYWGVLDSGLNLLWDDISEPLDGWYGLSAVGVMHDSDNDWIVTIASAVTTSGLPSMNPIDGGLVLSNTITGERIGHWDHGLVTSSWNASDLCLASDGSYFISFGSAVWKIGTGDLTMTPPHALGSPHSGSQWTSNPGGTITAMRVDPVSGYLVVASYINTGSGFLDYSQLAAIDQDDGTVIWKRRFGYDFDHGIFGSSLATTINGMDIQDDGTLYFCTRTLPIEFGDTWLEL